MGNVSPLAGRVGARTGAPTHCWRRAGARRGLACATTRPDRSEPAGHAAVSAMIGWGLAVLGIAAGYVGWGWPGVVLGVTLVVFWLLLQFSRSLRVLKSAAGMPVGHVDSAVMLHSKLEPGMTLMQVLRLTRSLGTSLGESPERWGWADPGGARVRLRFDGGKLQSWELIRGDGTDVPLPPPPAAA